MKLHYVSLSLVLAAAACSAKTQPPTQQPGNNAADGASQASAEPSPPLPTDPTVRTGQLENGLRYYIRKHEAPKQRAAMWLAVNAGSVQEDDDQRGLAHFVEHMAFNGTKRFEKHALIDFMEKAGMDFGSELNAYTSFDETVYQLTVPTDDPKVVARGFDILEDWASAVAFDPEEVEKERGVVIEEWRSGRGAQQRVFDEQWPVYLKGSKYSQRVPIGTKETLETAPVDALKRFYNDWYRPELMAVVVVGDVDPDEAETAIKQRFAKIKNPQTPRPRDTVEVPILDDTRAIVVTDPEAEQTLVWVTLKRKGSPSTTEADFRAQLRDDIFHGMLRARLAEIGERPDAPFVYGFSYTDRMLRDAEVFQMLAMSKTNQSEAALNVLMTEVERVRKHGFLASEFERQKAEVLRNYEKSTAEDTKVKARNHASRIVRAFLNGDTLVGSAQELELATRLLPSITLKEVNELANAWTASTDRIVTASGPARDDMPSEQQLLAVVDNVAKANVDAYTEEATATSLMAKLPQAGSIVSTETIDTIGTQEWSLSNGARVIVKPTDFKNDEVLFRAFSSGGTSRATNKEFNSARFASSVAMAGGIGEFSQTQLAKMMQGKDVNVSVFIDDFEEGLRGKGSPRDLETMMQMVHLMFTQPRFDQESFASFKARQREFVKNRDLDPQRVFFERLSAEAASGHIRRQPITLQDIEAVKLEDVEAFYDNRFADASDFTFIFVGNIDESVLRTYAGTYLASLPTKKRNDSWKDVGIRAPRGITKFEVKKGQDPKSFVMMAFHGKQKWSPEAADDLELVTDVMNIRLRQVLREEMSGVYGAFNFGEVERRPRQEYSLVVGFGCGPDNVQPLKTAVFKLIDELKTQGASAEDIEKIKATRARNMQTNLKENRYWMRELVDHYRYGTDPRTIVDANKATARVSSENVKKAAKRYFNTKRYIDGVLNPEVTAKPAAAKSAQ